MQHLFVLALVLSACNAKPAPTPAAEAPAAKAPEEAGIAGSNATQHVAPEGSSLPFTLVVGMSPEAEKMMKERNEQVKVSVEFHDGIGGDEGGYREIEFTMGPEGGILEVPATDLSPVKPANGPLTGYSINVFSARRSSENNLLQCSYVGGDVKDMLARANVECTPL